MIDKIILLSGHVSSGKTTLSEMLSRNFGAIVFKTRLYLKKQNENIESERSAMQNLGDVLDKKTEGSWVCVGLEETINENDSSNNKFLFIVDAVRIKKQIEHIRKAYGNKVLHVHLHPPIEELIERYEKRISKGFKELESFEEVLNNDTEKQVDDLKEIADIVIDTKRCTEDDVLVKAACHLGLYGREYSRHVDVLIGGQYGSEGKGNISAYLAPEYDILVRVGGPNAGHKVYDKPENLNFHHLPSGCKNSPESKILIGPGATIYIKTLFEEINKFDIAPDRLFIDKQTMVITEKDRKGEIILVKTIGSTGQGVGLANARRIRDRGGEVKLARDYKELNPYTCNTIEILQRAFINRKKIFLEGTQGTGLSLYHGKYPFVTSRDTTVAGCLAEAGISPSRVRRIIMVCRCYPIRVESPSGKTSGPLRNIKWWDVEERAGFRRNEIKKKELGSTSNKQRRVGEFEWVELRKASCLNAPTDIALTFVDYISKNNEKARRFEQLTKETIRFIEDVESVCCAPVSLISTRFEYRNIIDRRAW